MANPGEGYIGVMIAILCFGTYAVPTKFIKTGDGMMFQWIECAAIWILGLLIMFITGSYEFHPLAVLGGALWCLGNSTVVPIIGWIGLSMGMLVWGVANMVIGWACGHFGWFVGSKDRIDHPALNYVGLALALTSVLFYFPVKTTVKQIASTDINSDINNEIEPILGYSKDKGSQKQQETPFYHKILGLGGSLFAGVLYGFNMIPVSHLMSEEGADQEPLHYVFSHFTGIFLCSTVLVVIYAAAKKNRVWFNNQMVLPAFLSGTLWAFAQSAWFIANKNLGLSVAFPMITTGPGVVASLIGIVFFKEIQGSRNFMFLGTAFVLTFSGVLCIALSKQ